MPGKPWTTDEQAAFLTSYMPQYYKMKTNSTLSSIFWPLLFCEWFRVYPERSTWLPGSEELTVEQENLLGLKFKEQRKVKFIQCITMHY
jgi:hypothetical protein